MPSRRQRHQQAAGRVVEQGCSNRAAPPPGGERLLLLVPDDDQVALDLGCEPADLLDRLADGEVTAHREAALLQCREPLVEHALHALLLFLDQLLGEEPLGKKHARGHARDREQVRFGLGERRDLGAGKKRGPTLVRAVVGHEDPLVHQPLLSPVESRVPKHRLNTDRAGLLVSSRRASRSGALAPEIAQNSAERQSRLPAAGAALESAPAVTRLKRSPSCRSTSSVRTSPSASSAPASWAAGSRRSPRRQVSALCSMTPGPT